MAEDVKTLEDLKDVMEGNTEAAAVVAGDVEAASAVPAEPKIDAQGRAYATGKRKNAIARVWIKPG
ncbi:MAG: 30S ribosomal protein S9, partial [Rhodospirillaceae bacterium]|nr:30S ribosomal protein S9 [Rhodospirillaceae bacterium]